MSAGPNPPGAADRAGNTSRAAMPARGGAAQPGSAKRGVNGDQRRTRDSRAQDAGRASPPRTGVKRDEGDALRPEIPADIDLGELDREVRKELMTLPKGLADIVGGHLIMAARVLDDDPRLALAHTRFARSKAGRVAAVREAAGFAAYFAAEWSEALAELRAARRLSGGPGQLAVLADCERALGRPERALEIARSREASQLETAESVELRIVAAAARRDLGQLDAAVVALQGAELHAAGEEPWRARLRYAYADNLLAAGREQDAIRWFLAAAEADVDGSTDAAERAVELSDRAGAE